MCSSPSGIRPVGPPEVQIWPTARLQTVSLTDGLTIFYWPFTGMGNGFKHIQMLTCCLFLNKFLKVQTGAGKGDVVLARAPCTPSNSLLKQSCRSAIAWRSSSRRLAACAFSFLRTLATLSRRVASLSTRLSSIASICCIKFLIVSSSCSLFDR